jgi:hypothetical protein
MDRVIRNFRSHEEAGREDAKRDMEMTPQERIVRVLDLQAWK